ncbi:hypothetical protein ABK040_000967 [Willaertia magna]
MSTTDSLPLNNSENEVYRPINSDFSVTLSWKNKEKRTCDLDLVAILINKQGAIHDVCFYNNLNVSGLKHSGDDRNGFHNQFPKVLNSSSSKTNDVAVDSNKRNDRENWNERIKLDLMDIHADVRCIVFFVISYSGTYLSEVASAEVNIYEHELTDDDENPNLNLILRHQLPNSNDLCGHVFGILQKRGGDSEISVPLTDASLLQSAITDDDERSHSSDALTPNSLSTSPSLGKQDALISPSTNEEVDDSETYWELVSKNVEIGHNNRFLDAFQYAMCKQVLPRNLFNTMKNRLNYVIHMRKEEEKNKKYDKISTVTSMLKGEDNPEEEDYMVRVYSKLTGSILIDRLIVEEVSNFLEDTVEKRPFLPIQSKEGSIDLEPKAEDDETIEQQESEEKKSLIFDEENIKLCIGWEALSGRSYSRYYLTATVLFYGKYGAKISHIDEFNDRLTTTVSGTSVCPATFKSDYKQAIGKDNDVCCEIDLAQLPKSIQTIMVIITATSEAKESGFLELKDPYFKLINSHGDIYRYAIFSKDRNYQSLIACKLTCLDSDDRGVTQWKITDICDYSVSVNPLIDPRIKAQLEPYIEAKEPPSCVELVTQYETEHVDENNEEEKEDEDESSTEEEISIIEDENKLEIPNEPKEEKPRSYTINKQEVKSVGFDFGNIKNLKSVYVLAFTRHGKLVTDARPISVNEASDIRKRKLALSKAGGDTEKRQNQMFSSLSSFIRMDLSYSNFPQTPYFLCFLLKFKDFAKEEEELDFSLIPDKDINVFRLWNVDEKLDLCKAKLKNVFNVDGNQAMITSNEYSCESDANLAVIAYRGGQADQWIIEVLDEITPFHAPVRRYLRSILNVCAFDIREPSCPKLDVPSKTPVVQTFENDQRNLVLGIGIEGSGGNKHLLSTEVELYDHFARYLDKVFEYDKYNVTEKLKFRSINALAVSTQDDEEQYDIRVKDVIQTSTVKYIVCNVEVKTRSVLTSDSIIYCRVADMSSGEELIRVRTPATMFLDKYKPTANKNNTTTEDDPYASAEESDNDVVCTMCVIELTKTGWKLMGSGEKDVIDLVPKYLSPKPQALKMTIHRARNLVAVDRGAADPYLRIKLNEKNSRKGAKKQKVRTQVKQRTINPDWNETHCIHIFDYEDYLIIKCMDYEMTRDQYMGEYRVRVGDLLRLGKEGKERRFELKSISYWEAKEGKITDIKKKDQAEKSSSKGTVYITFSPATTKEVTTKK